MATGQLFSRTTQGFFYNYKQLPIQRMLDFDFLCGMWNYLYTLIPNSPENLLMVFFYVCKVSTSHFLLNQLRRETHSVARIRDFKNYFLAKKWLQFQFIPCMSSLSIWLANLNTIDFYMMVQKYLRNGNNKFR